MTTRRDFLRHTAAIGVSVATSASIRGGNAAEGHTYTEAPINARRTVPKTPVRIKSVIRREETVLRYGGNGDNWHMTWAADDRQYVGLCDGAGFSEHPKKNYNSRMLAISGGPSNAKFHDLAGYPLLGTPTQGPRDPRYYCFGTLSLNRHIYQFLSTFNRSFLEDESETRDLDELVRFIGAKLIYSPDMGHTWYNHDGSTPVVWEPWDRRSRDSMVFFEEDQETFSLLTVLQMGKNYSYNRDGYVYVYAPNGNVDGAMNELVMFRTPRARILYRTDYEYFAGLTLDGKAKWTKAINDRKPVHTFPRGWVNTLAHPYAWHPSVVYNAALDLYMMANWGMGTASTGMWFGKPSYLGFWIAPNPWGPWTQIHEETAWMPEGYAAARAYQPQIAPKWIAADGKSFWLVWTDFQERYNGAYARFFNEEFREKYWRNQMTENDWARIAQMSRKYRPYYAFNVQRVDLLVT